MCESDQRKIPTEPVTKHDDVYSISSMKRLFLLCALIWASPHATAENAYYRGIVGKHTGLSLQIDPESKETAGSVRYDSSGSDGLSLEAKLFEAGRFEWLESLYSREKGYTQETGKFSGEIWADGKNVQGQWTSLDGRKSLPFQLTRQARLVKIMGKAGEGSVGYPQFDDPHFSLLNQQLATKAKQDLTRNLAWTARTRKEIQSIDAARDNLSHIERSNQCDVEFASRHLVSLGCLEFEYAGGAHPNTVLSGQNYTISPSGQPRKLGLWDILKKSPAAVNRLSELLIKDLKRQRASWVINGSNKNFDQQLNGNQLPFLLTPSGLAFQFSQYMVGSYAEGSFRSIIPYRDISSHIRRDGPLGNRLPGDHE